MSSPLDLIPIAFAFVGLFTLFRWAYYGLVWTAAKVRDRVAARRARRALAGRDLLVQRMDTLEARMDTLEGHMAHIIDLLERREAA